jgi:hypothetical protein
MRIPRLRVRTVLIIVAVVAVLLELSMLGEWSRRYARLAREAAEAEQLNARIASNSQLAASQQTEQADRIEAREPARAAELRAQAARNLRGRPFFEGQSRRAARARAVYERAATHPWEGAPPEATDLRTTAPVERP